MCSPCRPAKQRGDRGGRIGEEPGAELRIGPGFRDYLRAIARANLGLVGLDEGVDMTAAGVPPRRMLRPFLGLAGLVCALVA